MSSYKWLFALALFLFTANAWYYSQLPARRLIEINETISQNLTNQSVLLEIPHDNDMRSDYGDIRFTFLNETSNTEVELSYWIEETSSTSAKVWVRLPVLNQSVRIYMYYGNPSFTSASDGEDTFMFFDSFEGSSLNTNKWHEVGSVGSYEVENGWLKLWSDWGACCNGACYYNTLGTHQVFDLPLVVRLKFYQSPYTSVSNCGRTGPAILYENKAEFIQSTSTGSAAIAFRIGSSSYSESGVPFPSGNNTVSITFNSSGIYVNASWISTIRDFERSITGTGWVGIAGDTDDGTITDYIDYIAVYRPYPPLAVYIGQEEKRVLSVDILSPEDDEFVTSPVRVSVNITLFSNATLSYYLDDSLILQREVSENGTINTSFSMSVGSHDIFVELNTSDRRVNDTVSFVVLPPPSKGGGSTSVSYRRIAKEVWEYSNISLWELHEEIMSINASLSSKYEELLKRLEEIKNITSRVESTSRAFEEKSGSVERMERDIGEISSTLSEHSGILRKLSTEFGGERELREKAKALAEENAKKVEEMRGFQTLLLYLVVINLALTLVLLALFLKRINRRF